MRNICWFLAIGAWLCIADCNSANAQIINGDFTAGATGWVSTAPTNSTLSYGGDNLVASSDDDGSGFTRTFSSQAITLAEAGFVDFTLVSYTSVDVGNFDYPMVLLNGTFFQILGSGALGTDGGGGVNNGNPASNVTGTIGLAVGGHTIGFGVTSTDAIFGPGIATWDSIQFQELTQSPVAQSTNEDVDLVLSGTNAPQVATNSNLTGMNVTLSVTNGDLALSTLVGITITGGANNSSTISFSGTPEDINSALNGLTFSPIADFNGPSTLSFSVMRGGISDTDTIAINVISVPDLSFSIAKLVDVSDTSVPTTLNYTISVTNTGDTDLTNPSLMDTVQQGVSPRALTFGPMLSSGDVDADNELDIGEVWTYIATYDVSTTDISNGGDIVNTATFDTLETLPSQDDVTTTISPVPPPPPAPASCSGTALEVNGGFETPGVPGAPPTFGLLAPELVPGWTTTDTAIELWDNGFLGVPSHSGLQFAELNANNPGTLTQTGTVNSRAELLYYWAHRARSLTIETASLIITDNGGGSTVFGNYSSGTGAWNTFSMIHVANPDATSFSAAHSSILGGSLGNFHDTIEACQTYITLSKSEFSRQDLDNSGGDSAGDTVTYRFVITNPAGNERGLGTVSIIDDQIGPINVAFADSGDTNANGLLDPGESWIRDEEYTLTQADMDASSVTNIAYAEASTSDNTLRSDDAIETVTLVANPSITIIKTADDEANVTLGQIITYTYVVTNDGNQTITAISLSDAHSGSGPAPVPGSEILSHDSAPFGDSTDSATDGNWDSLAPGDSVTFTGTYTVTQNDVDTLQ
ncbi:MAG: hypothetical protein AAF478_02835 [Pseudomonadota bacterium]